MKIKYTINGKINPQTLHTCDEGAKGFQDALYQTAKTVQPRFAWLIWCMARFYKRTITKKKVTYNFYVLGFFG